MHPRHEPHLSAMDRQIRDQLIGSGWAVLEFAAIALVVATGVYVAGWLSQATLPPV